MLCLSAAAHADAPFVARSAGDFIAAIGVNTHLDAPESSYGNVHAVIEQLRFLGVRHVRDASVGLAQLAPYRSVAKAGAVFDLIVKHDPQGAMPTLRAMAPFLSAIEGPNEVNVIAVQHRGQTGDGAAMALQRDLYGLVKHDPALARLPVYNFTLAQGSSSYAPFGDMSAFADRTNVHAYAQYGAPPHVMLQPVISGVTDTPGRPPVVTEIGSYTMPDGDSGVSEPVQAKWVLDTLLDNFSHAVEITYVYQLQDGLPDPGNTDSEQHYGLFAVTGRAKPAAVALHNLVTILGRGAGHLAGAPSLSVTVSGLRNDDFGTLLAKPGGVFDLVVWAEPEIWDHRTRTETPGPPHTVRLGLPRRFAHAAVFDTLHGTDAIARTADTDSVDITLTDHPIIVEVTPG